MEEETFYSEKDLVSFGNFVLSQFDDRVTPEDLENWKWKIKNEQEE